MKKDEIHSYNIHTCIHTYRDHLDKMKEQLAFEEGRDFETPLKKAIEKVCMYVSIHTYLLYLDHSMYKKDDDDQAHSYSEVFHYPIHPFIHPSIHTYIPFVS